MFCDSEDKINMIECSENYCLLVKEAKCISLKYNELYRVFGKSKSNGHCLDEAGSNDNIECNYNYCIIILNNK